MIVRQSLWLAGMAGLVLLVVGLGCSVCPFVPQPPTATSPSPTEERDEDTPIPERTRTPEPTLPPGPTSTPVVVLGDREPYTNPMAGFSILYPGNWMYEEQVNGAFFAQSEDALGAGGFAEEPLFIVLAGAPEDIESDLGKASTSQDLLDTVQESLCGGEENCEAGEVETWTFGETPGVGQELSWESSMSGEIIRGYLVAAVSDKVAGIGFAGSPEDDYASFEQTFQDMFASLEFFPPEVPEPVEKGTIRSGETVEGTLLPGGMDVWSFDAQAGQYVTIRLDAVDIDDMDTYLELYDADGTLLIEDDDGGDDRNSAIGEFPIPDTGTFYIHATPYDGRGDYTLSLEIADEPSGGGEIKYGDTVEGDLIQSVQHYWMFEGEAGDVVAIAMNATDDDLDCYLTLYDPDDDWLTENDDGGEGFNAFIDGYVLPSSGTYRIVASGVGGGSGSYELNLEQVELIVEGTLVYGDEMTATLDPGKRHNWLFEGDEGDVVTISMVALDESLDAYLELFSPSGERLTTDDDSGGNSNAMLSEFELPETGTYRILARGFGGSSAGEYELALTGP